MTNIEWKKDWMSEVYFQSNGIKEVIKEYYTYESSDLLGDFGGFLVLLGVGRLVSVTIFLLIGMQPLAPEILP